MQMLAYLALLLFSGPKVEPDVVYAKVSGVDLMMDLYRPEVPSAKPTGAVVVIHGGGWMGGNRKQMSELCDLLAKKGLFAATVQYRLAPAFRWPAMLDDVQTAVRYLRTNAAKYNIDPNRIGATGASAGGHLSLMLGFTDTRDLKTTLFPKESSHVAAVLNLFGPTDMSQDYPPFLDSMFETVLGKKKADAAAEIKAASPVTWVSDHSAPVFTIHGDKDPLVPIIQSKRLDDALKAHGIFHERRIVKGLGHEIAKTNADCMKAMDDGINWLVGMLAPKG